jgi:hypothetical protein
MAEEKTMDEVYKDGSDHICCPICGLCKTCDDCKLFGCGSEIEVSENSNPLPE